MDDQVKKDDTKSKNDWFLVFGYRAAITLAFIGILFSSYYLFMFIDKSHPEEIKFATETAYNTERKTVLLSTAIFVAMSFGFLGFGLFLINAKGDVDGSANFTEHVQIKFAKLSPGLFVILCATVIIVFAITHNIEYQAKIPTSATDTTHIAQTTQADSNANGAAYKRNPPNTNSSKPGSKPTKKTGHK